jgi:hypothetical protein
VQKIVRHFERKHKDELEVKKFLSMPKQSEQRKAITTKLRNLGNHNHNVSVLKKKEGSLIVARRLGGEAKSLDDVALCKNCLGYYAKDSLYRHHCSVFSMTPAGLAKKPGTVKEGKGILESTVRGLSAEAADIFSTMLMDDVGLAVRNDDVAVEFLELQLQKGEGHKPNWKKQIRYRLRLLGRLILEARNLIQGSYNLRDILICPNFRRIAEAAKECAKKEGHVGNSVPVKIGFMVKACAEVLLAEASEKLDEKKLAGIKSFLKLYKMHWGTRWASFLYIYILITAFTARTGTGTFMKIKNFHWRRLAHYRTVPAI